MNVDKLKSKLLVKFPLFGSIVSHLKILEDKDCYCNGQPTAATDGNNIYYHPDFMNNITEEEQLFTLAHEVCHIAFNHIFRSENKDVETWNIAADSVINALLQSEGLKMPEGGVDIPEAINHDVEEMYQKLLKDEDFQKNKGNNHQLSDSHDRWSKAIEDNKNEVNQGQTKEETNSQEANKNSIIQKAMDKILGKKSENDNKINNQNKEKEQEKQIKEQINKIAQLGENKVFKQNKIERKKQLEELRNAITQSAISTGGHTNASLLNVENIGIASPLIDWRLLLREAANYNVDWTYKNASIEDGIITPYLEDIPISVTEIVLDTSGSINQVLLKNFLRECKNIFLHSKVRVGCFDTRFYGFEEIDSVDDIDNITFKGGGNTDFNAAVNAFSTRAENKIIFTDGRALMPDKAIDAVWIVFGNKRISPKGGKVIYIDQEQLEKLNAFYSSSKHR